MQRNKSSKKNFANILLVFTLFSSLLAQMVSPLSAYADSNVEEAGTTVVEKPVNLTPEKTSLDGDFDLSIMHMNDTHSRVENYPFMLAGIKAYRETNPEALLLHAGDVFSGTLYFNEFQGQADLALLNLMEFDAMVFGNHEFDLGKSAEGHKALSEFVNNANFPFLGSNSDFTQDPNMKQFEPKESLIKNPEAGDAYNSIIVEREGEEIGIFGLTTEDTKDIASPVKVTFSNYIETAKAEVKKLEDAGINKIIAVTHIGYDSAPAVGNDLLLAEHVDGIDVIVGGHSHTKLDEPKLIEKEGKASTVIVQAGQYAENLGTVEVTFNASGEIIEHTGKLISLGDDRNGRPFEADAEALKVLAPYKATVEVLSSTETGATAKKALVNPRLGADSNVSVRANETALGNLITDAMLAKAKEKEPDTVIAFQNGGGIREAIDKGPITVGEVISVLPFGNNPVVAELTGLEIKEILEHAIRHDAGTENGGFLHISGMKYYYDTTKEAGNRVMKMLLVDEKGIETEIKPDGNRTYKITTNGFTGQGGDGFDTFKKAYAAGRVKDIGEEDWQQLVDYMVEEEYLNGVVDPEIEGRITDLKGEDLPGEPTDPEDEEKIGWVKEGSDWYYYDDKGVMQTGWAKINGTWYYMTGSGVMRTGWTRVGKTWYYMNNSGAMQTGWTRVGKTWYYMSNSGAMQTGWNKVGNTWYYMSNSGAMQTGWNKVGNTWYYMSNSGAMQTGWNKVGNTWYYMSNSGAMQTGWNKLGNTWYYMSNSGAMQTGWNKVGPTWYYMSNSGAMQTGWIKWNNNWYYLNDDGSMEIGNMSMKGVWYRFNSSGRITRRIVI